MKRYFVLIILLVIVSLQFNSCDSKYSDIKQAEITGRLIYSDMFNIY